MGHQPSFLNSLYDESFGLLVEAHNYFRFSNPAKARDKNQTVDDRLFINYQAMRLTSRMTQAMAWLLAQRAVQSGELTPPEACSGKFSLGGEVICTDSHDHEDHRLPASMQRLMDRSHALYMRVWRLDQQSRSRVEAVN